MSVVLSEHLPLLASAPDGIQKLRGLILELAVRGKLVPQDPNDEPATELLKRIARERARLEAEGSCKKSKATPIVGKDEQPFALPEGWAWSRLCAVSFINPRNSADDSAIASFVPMAMIGTSFDGKHLQEHRKWAEIKQGFTHFAEKDIGVAKITPCFENSKACVFENLQSGIGAGTTELHIVRPIGQTLLPRFVLAYLKAPMFLLVGETRMTGTAGQKRLPKDFLELNPFPLPPLAEQHRIVTKVDELMALCDRLEAEVGAGETAHVKLVETLLGTLTQSADAVELAANWQRLAEHFDTLFTTESSLDALKQSILQLAVIGKLVPQDPKDEPASELLKRIAKERTRLETEGKVKKSKPVPPVGEDEQPFVLPGGWVWARLADSLAVVTDGDHLPPPKANSGVPFLVIGNLNAGKISFEGCRYVPEAYFNALDWSKRPMTGDLLYTVTGSYGITIPVKADAPFCVQRHVAILKSVTSSPTPYLLRYLQSSSAKSFADLVATGIAQKTVTLGALREMPIAVPPAPEQHRIVAKVDELMALCDRLKADLAESRNRQTRLSTTLIESALQAA